MPPSAHSLLSRAPGVEGFVAGLDAYGNWVWADGFGGEKDDIAYSVSWLGLGKNSHWGSALR